MVLQGFIAVRRARRELDRMREEGLVRSTDVFTSALRTPEMQRLLSRKKGVFKGGVLDFSVLNTELGKDKEFRREFMAILGRTAKSAGLFRGIRISDETAGMAVFSNVKRVYEAADLAGLGPLAAEQVRKLNDVYDFLASKYAKGNVIEFYRKYTTDEGFKNKVNAFLRNQIRVNPDFKVFQGIDPEAIVHSAASIKLASLSTRDKVIHGGKYVVKRTPIEAAKAFGMMGVQVASALSTAVSAAVLANVPGGSTAMWGLASATQHAANVLFSSWKEVAEKRAWELEKLAKMRKQMEEARAQGVAM